MVFEGVREGRFKNPNHWNQSFIIKVPELDVDRLKTVISVLANHHDVLRAAYTKIEMGVIGKFMKGKLICLN